MFIWGKFYFYNKNTGLADLLCGGNKKNYLELQHGYIRLIRPRKYNCLTYPIFYFLISHHIKIFVYLSSYRQHYDINDNFLFRLFVSLCSGNKIAKHKEETPTS